MELYSQISGFIRDDANKLNIFGNILYALIYLAVVLLIIRFISYVIDKWMKKSIDSKYVNVDANRIHTISSMVKTVVKWFFIFVWLVACLDSFGVSTKSIIATAGLGSVAIGFGAQSLVKDIITGFFILLEDQYRVGDYVKISGYEGNVIEFGLRVTKLRSLSGEHHIIPNSTISAVSNYSRGDMRSLVVLSVGYHEDIDVVTKVVESLCDRLSKEKIFVSAPQLLGITKLGDYCIEFTIVGMTRSGEQFAGERLIRREAKYAFDEAGIEIPYPTTTIVKGDIDA